MTKEECEKALDYFLEETLIEDYASESDNRNYDILHNLIEERYNPKPYEFEDLKTGMWVYDDICESCLKIIGFDKKQRIVLSVYAFSDMGIVEHISYSYFEKGRFYPITKAICKVDKR